MFRRAFMCVLASVLAAVSCSSATQPDTTPPPPPTPSSLVTGACGYSVQSSETTRSTTAEGGTVNVRVLANTAASVAGCTWTVNISDDARDFISLVEPASGSSSASDTTVVITVAANTGGRRTGTVTIAGVPFSIVQTEAPCVLTLSGDLNVSFPAAGGTGRIAVTRTQGGSCAWTATTTASFVTIASGASGTNDGTVTFTVARNTDQARTGTLTIAGQTVTVSQETGIVPCRFTVSPTAINFGPGVGTGSVTVTRTQGTNCTWAATTTSPFLAITSGANGSDNGTVAFTVAPNTEGARTGTLTVAGQTVTVSQDSGLAVCRLNVSPTSIQFGPLGGTGIITVTRTQGTNCSWTATTPASFITITAGASGTDSGTVTFTVAANTDTASRIAPLNIAGQLVTVTQDPQTACRFTVAPATFSFASAGGAGTVTVTRAAGTNCSWTATTTATFITITTGATGTDNGTVTFTVASTTGPTRTGTLTIAGETVAVTQTVSGVSGIFQGAFASTAPTSYGGAPLCNYTVVLNNVTSTVQFASNQVTRADVMAVMVETALQGCPSPPIPTNTHSYALRSSTVNGQNVTIDYTAASGNAPHATLQLAGTLSADNRALSGTLTWQRDDQASAPTLNWRVTATITMTAP
jgi:hypothetical protein